MSAVLTRVSVGAGTSSTVKVSVAVSVPPFPSEIVYEKLTVPL